MMRHDPRSEETGAVAGTTPDCSASLPAAALMYPSHVSALADLGQAVIPAHVLVRLIILSTRGHGHRMAATHEATGPNDAAALGMALKSLDRMQDRRYFDHAVLMCGQVDPWLISDALDRAGLSDTPAATDGSGERRPS